MKNSKVYLLLIALVSSLSMAFSQNTLSKAEKNKGWKLLFDGKTTKGWHTFNTTTIGSAWKVENGALYLDNTEKVDWQVKGGGDIVSDKEYENFELRLEWKIQACGNSGILFNIVESKEYQYVWQTGPEMQVLDNTCHPDAKIIKHRAGDLYDLITVSKETVKPAGEWNTVRIISKNGLVEFFLNEEKVVSFQMHNQAWFDMIAASKFKDMPAFGRAKKGHLALQDHGDKVWYRNIKIREIK